MERNNFAENFWKSRCDSVTLSLSSVDEGITRGDKGPRESAQKGHFVGNREEEAAGNWWDQIKLLAIRGQSFVGRGRQGGITGNGRRKTHQSKSLSNSNGIYYAWHRADHVVFGQVGGAGHMTRNQNYLQVRCQTFAVTEGLTNILCNWRGSGGGRDQVFLVDLKKNKCFG